MRERVVRLREQSINAMPSITMERAELVTAVYQRYEGEVSTPVLRALTFKHLMENKAIYIGEDELIVGERGPGPKATPTYPELCCHTIDDLQIINDREKITFNVDERAMAIQRERIIPCWDGKSMRDRIFSVMTEKWRDCYQAGMFTEFMEQRAPGHTVGDEKIYRQGMLDFKAAIEAKLRDLDDKDPDALQKRQQWKAMQISADALVTFARRHSDRARQLADIEEDPARKRELERIAEVTHRVPAHAPRNFWEALQAYWFVHLAVITELNTWDAFCPGRLDQHLYPFYRGDLDSDELTPADARELLQCFWVKFNNHPAPPKVGVTLEESGTYTDFANINIGGLKPDGSDGVNEISYMLLEVVNEMRLTQPSSNIQVSKRSPNQFIRKAVEVIKGGFGQPSIFNTDAIISELLRQGKSIEDARCGGTSGCVEAGAFGKEAYILTGYFNLTKVLEITLNDGIDPASGKRIGVRTGDPRGFSSFEDLFDAYRTQLNHFIDIKIEGNHAIEKMYADTMPSPFLSLVIDDCIETGRDYNSGGARYNTNYIQGVGIGTISDSLSAIKYHVYDHGNITMDRLLTALAADYEDEEPLRQLLMNRTPRYGNDDDYVDDLMRSVFETFYQAVEGRPTMRGGTYRINMLPTTSHVYFGSVIGATPEGRKEGLPLSEGISPVQGADRAGPTAVIRSAGKMDQLRTGGTLLNQRFAAGVLEGEGLTKFVSLIRSYFRLDGHHIQFNVVDADTLRAAQREPEKHRDLIVRVAGYSDYFNHLNRKLQDEIISRTEHQAF